MVWFGDTCEGLPVRYLAGTDSNGNSDRIGVSHASSIPLNFERCLLTAKRGAAASRINVRGWLGTGKPV